MKFIDVPSPNFTLDKRPVKAVCLHGTAAAAAASISWLRNPQPKNPKAAVSANFLIARSGDIYQLVDPAKGRKAWANGVIELPDPSLVWLQEAIRNKVNPNWLTWSIEHEATDDEMRWHKSMTDKQFNSSIELTAWLLRMSGLKANHETVVGHCQISSKQKSNCPGVIFIPAYTEVLIKRNPDLKDA